MHPSLSHIRIAPLALALLLAACGGGGGSSDNSNSGGSDDGGNGGGTTPEPSAATLSLAVTQLPQGASLLLEQASGDATLNTLSFNANGSQTLSTYAVGNVLRIASATPALPQTHLLQCAFASTELGTIGEDGSLTLTQAPAEDSSIAVKCGRTHLFTEWKADGGRPTGFLQAVYGYAELDIDNGTVTWLKDASGTAVSAGSGGATGFYGSLPSAYFQGKVWFRAYDDTHGSELWSSDGTTAGTQLAIDLNPGVDNGNPNDLNPLADRLFLTANTGSGNTWLESQDGASASAVSRTFNGSTVNCCQSYSVIGDTLFVTTGGQGNVNNSNNVNGSLLYRNIDSSDDLTLLIKPRATFGDGYRQTYFSQALGDKLLFGQYTNSGAMAGGRNYLAVTDGTEANTSILVSEYNLIPGYYGTGNANLATLNGEFYFAQASDAQTLGSAAQQQLYKTDGTANGTVALTSFSNGEMPVVLQTAGDTLYFLAQTGNLVALGGSAADFSDDESVTLWKVGPNDAAAVQVAPNKTAPAIVHERNSQAPVYMTHSSLHAAGSRVVYTGTDGHLWGSDGTDAGTVRLFPDLADGRTVPAIGDCATHECLLATIKTVNDQALITVRTPYTNYDSGGQHIAVQYWLTDGTPEGTRAVTDKETGELFVHSFELAS